MTRGRPHEPIERVRASRGSRTIRLVAALVVITALLASGVGATARLGSPPIQSQTEDGSEPFVRFDVSPNPASTNESVTLDASNSSDPDDDSLVCVFDVDGDGEFETERETCRLTQRYAEPGEYPVAVEVRDSAGNVNRSVETLTVVANLPPVAVFDYTPPWPDPGETVTFDASRSGDPDGAIAEYRWDLTGDGQHETVDGPVVSRAYRTAGTTTVRLAVVDRSGATAATSHRLSVEPNRPPIARIEARPDPATVDAVTTIDGSASSDPDGDIHRWEFDADGDGRFETQTESGRVPVRYADAGDYPVRMRITDDDGATATASMTLTVWNTSDTVGVSNDTDEEIRPDATPPGRTDSLWGLPGVLATIRATIDAIADTIRTGAGDLGRAVGPATVGLSAGVLLVLVGLIAVAWRRSDRVRDRGRSLKRRLSRRLTKRKIAERVLKKGVKRLFRKAGEAVESGGHRFGETIRRAGRRLGDAVERTTTRIGGWLRRLGS